MLTEIRRKILATVQEPLAICVRPFMAVAERTGCTESECLAIINDLKARGYIRRFGVVVDYAAMGRAATLVTTTVGPERMAEVAASINALAGVSHHYLRRHHFNLWFTLQGESAEDIEKTLIQLEQQTGQVFYSLPAERVFKLDVRFCPDGPSQRDFEADKYTASAPAVSVIGLTEEEKNVLRLLQGDFPVVETPFEFLGRQAGVTDVERVTVGLIGKKVIRRIAAIVNYQRLGYYANGMVSLAVPTEKIEAVGIALSSRAAVSHCYQRRLFEGWPYNVFAMMHAGKMEDIEQFISGIVKQYGIEKFVVLETEKELKKVPVQYEALKDRR